MPVTSVSVIEGLVRLSRSSAVGGAAIVVSNLIPLAGVLWWGWDVFVIVFLYWLENGVIGLFNALKIRKELDASHARSRDTLRLFVANYGLFWAVHGIFVLALPGFVNAPFQLPNVAPLGLLLGIAALTLSHAGQYAFVFLREQEYLQIDPQRQLWQPYPRLFTLHFVIIFGAIGIAVLGQPVALVLLLVLFKTSFELGAYALHRGQSASVEDVSATTERRRPDATR